MSRKQNSNEIKKEDLLRISFQLDLSHNEELSFLRDIHRHGDRPRELIRLAIKGRRRELELEQLAQAGHSFVMRSVAGEVDPHTGDPHGIDTRGAEPREEPRTQLRTESARVESAFVQPTQPSRAPSVSSLSAPSSSAPSSSAPNQERSDTGSVATTHNFLA